MVGRVEQSEVRPNENGIGRLAEDRMSDEDIEPTDYRPHRANPLRNGAIVPRATLIEGKVSSRRSLSSVSTSLGRATSESKASV